MLNHNKTVKWNVHIFSLFFKHIFLCYNVMNLFVMQDYIWLLVLLENKCNIFSFYVMYLCIICIFIWNTHPQAHASPNPTIHMCFNPFRWLKNGTSRTNCNSIDYIRKCWNQTENRSIRSSVQQHLDQIRMKTTWMRKKIQSALIHAHTEMNSSNAIDLLQDAFSNFASNNFFFLPAELNEILRYWFSPEKNSFPLFFLVEMVEITQPPRPFSISI